MGSPAAAPTLDFQRLLMDFAVRRLAVSRHSSIHLERELRQATARLSSTRSTSHRLDWPPGQPGDQVELMNGHIIQDQAISQMRRIQAADR
ncbi:MAG TPA: hypothetical protein VGA07_09715, partial [Anaerolineales bacterium]